jgi:hypothetical protein
MLQAESDIDNSSDTEESKENKIKPLVIVRKYDLFPPLNWGDDCRDHLYMGNELWNRLVEIEHQNQKEWHEVFEQDPDYAALKARADRISEEIDQLWEERKRRRAELRTKATPEDEAFEKAINEKKKVRSAIWADSKKLRSKLKKQFEHQLKLVETTRKERAVRARQEAAAKNVFWGTYNAILDSYRVARSQALKTNSRLRFHAFDGTGRFVNQIQRQSETSPPGMSVKDLFEGRRSQAKLEPISKEMREHLGFKHPDIHLLTVTVYTTLEGKVRTRRDLTFPLVYSREIPSEFGGKEVRIKEVEVVIRRKSSVPLSTEHQGIQYDGYRIPTGYIPRRTTPSIGDQFEFSAIFTCTTYNPPGDLVPPEKPVHSSSTACGINLGWLRTKHGIRIATVVDSKGHKEYHYLPPSVLERLDYCETLQSELDERANEMRARLKEWLKEEEGPEDWREAVIATVKSQSPERLHRLALLWRDWNFRPDWRQELEDWRNFKRPKIPPGKTHEEMKRESPEYRRDWRRFLNSDRVKRQQMEGLRTKAIGCRRDFYQNLAKTLCERYAIIGLGQLDLRKAAKLVHNDEETDLPAPVRSMRQKVCLSELMEWLEKQAAKTGALVQDANRPVTITCHRCNSKQTVKPELVMHVCTNCSAVWDRDDNGAIIALQDVTGDITAYRS